MAEQQTADDRIAKLEARVSELETVIAGLRAVFTGGASDVADDRDLDSARGDEKARFDPRDWKGESQKGRTMSRCTPEFLDFYADAAAYFATKTTDPKKAGYDRKTAARARGWAKRLRAGWKPPPEAPPAENPFASGSTSEAAPASNGNGYAAPTAAGFAVDPEHPFGNGVSNPFASSLAAFDDDERAAIQDEALDETEKPL